MPRLKFPHRQKTSTSCTLSAISKGRALRVLFLTNAHNGMSQALYLNLKEQGHQVTRILFRCAIRYRFMVYEAPGIDYR